MPTKPRQKKAVSPAAPARSGPRRKPAAQATGAEALPTPDAAQPDGNLPPRPRRKPAEPKKTAPSARTSKPRTDDGPSAVAPRNMKPAEVVQFLRDLASAWPDAKTELDYTGTFSLLVAVVLSAQATDASVNKVTPGLFAAAPTPQAMVALGEDGVGALIRTIGLWRAKAHNVVELSRQLLALHGGQVPDTREALEQLAGVGRKTANVVLSVAFGQPTVPVDTHVFRLANRSGLGRGSSVVAVEKALEQRIPQDMKCESHHWMILQGRYVCKARKPECWRCVARDVCLFPAKTSPPRPTARRA